MECTLNEIQRRYLINNIIASYLEFGNWNLNNAFVFLLQTTDPKILNSFTKFVYNAFQIKASHVATQNG